MEGEDWLTFSEASEKAGKEKAYFSNLHRRCPEYFAKVVVKKYGRTYVMKEEAIRIVRGNLKTRSRKKGS